MYEKSDVQNSYVQTAYMQNGVCAKKGVRAKKAYVNKAVGAKYAYVQKCVCAKNMYHLQFVRDHHV